MKPSVGFSLWLILMISSSLVGCDHDGVSQEELKQIHQEIKAVREELRLVKTDVQKVKQIVEDTVPHLENLEEILKLTRREVGVNGDAISGLRDHITLTVKAFAADGKEGSPSELSAEDLDALVIKLEGLGVALDTKARTLTLEGVVATPAGALEFACVAEGGKSHESLFMLRSEPRALNAGLLALGLNPGIAGRFTGGKPVSPTGPKVYLYATWSDQGKEVTHRLEDLIIDLRTQKPLIHCGFVYHGSRHERNTVTGKRFYVADVTRDLVAVWNSPNTILDLSTPEASWDDAYVANSKVMPPKGTPVKVIVRLEEK